jgi:hypothetical protein
MVLLLFVFGEKNSTANVFPMWRKYQQQGLFVLLLYRQKFNLNFIKFFLCRKPQSFLSFPVRKKYQPQLLSALFLCGNNHNCYLHCFAGKNLIAIVVCNVSVRNKNIRNSAIVVCIVSVRKKSIATVVFCCLNQYRKYVRI